MERLNKRIAGLQPSKSMAFMAKANQLRATDPGIINLAGGEPDFDTPKRIREELYRWLEAGYTHYTNGRGEPELRERIARKLREENGCDYDADGILIAPGGKYAIYLAVRALVNEGDEVMYLEPGWVSYPSIIEASGGRPVPVRLDYREDYRLSLEKLQSHVSDRTKLLIINYPNNPTGKVLSSEDAAVLERFLLDHPQVMLLADDMYERIVYEGFSHISMGSFRSIADRVITVNGFSKSVAMTGWRIGYLATTPELADVIYKLFQHTISCVSGFIQKAAVVALDCCGEMEEMRKQYERRRTLFVGGFNEIPGVECAMPEGAFYAWVKFDAAGMDSEEICDYMLQKARVVGVPGSAYGTDECCVRFSFASSEKELAEAVTRIAGAMGELKKRERTDENSNT